MFSNLSYTSHTRLPSGLVSLLLSSTLLFRPQSDGMALLFYSILYVTFSEYPGYPWGNIWLKWRNVGL